jgi:hypothetical protein
MHAVTSLFANISTPPLPWQAPREDGPGKSVCSEPSLRGTDGPERSRNICDALKTRSRKKRRHTPHKGIELLTDERCSVHDVLLYSGAGVGDWQSTPDGEFRQNHAQRIDVASCVAFSAIPLLE